MREYGTGTRTHARHTHTHSRQGGSNLEEGVAERGVGGGGGVGMARDERSEVFLFRENRTEIHQKNVHIFVEL